MKFSDRLIGIIAVLGGAAVYAGTLDFRAIPGQQYGSAFFPRIVAVALIVTGLVLLIRQTQKIPLHWPAILRGWSGIQIALVLLSVMVWVWLAPVLGFILTTALLIVVLILLAGGRVLTSCLTATGVALLLYVIFAVLLRVPLPRGFVEQLIL